MYYDETQLDASRNELHYCRVRYAAFVYDRFISQKLSHKRAFAKAVEVADINPLALKWYLPKHRKIKKTIRNAAILNYRAQGYSINLLADRFELSRSQIGRIIDSFSDKLLVSKKMSRWKKPRKRLDPNDPFLGGEENFLFFFAAKNSYNAQHNASDNCR